MSAMLFPVALAAATLLAALTSGLVFTFARITMPGIAALGDREFVRAFQAMDRIIQNNDPLFMLVWGGSALLLPVAAVLGFGTLAATPRAVLIAATVLFWIGVQIPTVIVNVPLNNGLQQVDTLRADDATVAEARRIFESRWNRWNRRRTVISIIVVVALLVVAIQT